MRFLERIFRAGRKHFKLTVWIYKTKRAMRKRANKDNLEGMCWKEEKGNDCHILMTEGGLKDGTLEHEAMHVIQFVGIKNDEHQAGGGKRGCGGRTGT